MQEEIKEKKKHLLKRKDIGILLIAIGVIAVIAGIVMFVSLNKSATIYMGHGKIAAIKGLYDDIETERCEVKPGDKFYDGYVTIYMVDDDKVVVEFKCSQNITKFINEDKIETVDKFATIRKGEFVECREHGTYDASIITKIMFPDDDLSNKTSKNTN